MDLRTRAPKGDWACPTCRAADDLTRLDERPRKLQRRTHGSRTTDANTTVVPVPAPPEAAAPQDHLRPQDVAAPLRKRGRPRKVVAISEAAPEIVPRDPSAHSEALGEVPSRGSNLALPHSRATRLGTAAHGVTLTPAAPTAARMLLVQEWPAPGATPSCRRVCFTTSASPSLPLSETGTHRARRPKPENRRVRWINQR